MEIPHGRAAAIDGLRGAGIALETVATLALMCDPRDLGCTLGDTALDEPGVEGAPRKARGGPTPGYDPTLFLYEHTPGGIGLSQRIFEERETLLARALELVQGCPCESGCPACVGPANPLTAPPADVFGMMEAANDAGQDRKTRDRGRSVTGRKGVAIEILRRARGSRAAP